MATLTPTLALTSTDATGDTLSISVTDSLTIGANKVRLSRTYSPNDVDPGGVQIFNTNLGPSYMYLKNTHATLKIHIQAAADTAEGAAWMELKAGEFAFFCWAGVVNLFASTGDNGAGIATDGLEVIIFEI